MITCRKVVRRLADLVSPSRTATEDQPAKGRGLLKHLDDCASCRAYRDGYLLVIQLGRRLRCPPLPDRLTHRLAALVEERKKEERAESFGCPEESER